MRKQFSVVLAFLCVSSIILIQPPTVEAETKTIFVPDDFPTISTAIANATAGDTIFVKNGSYTEWELKITKPLSLVGENAGSTKLSLQSKRYVGEPLYWYLPDLFAPPVWYGRAMYVHTDNFVLSGFTITTNGGDINITGNNNQIKSNAISADLTIAGSNNKIIDNIFSENPTAQYAYPISIKINHCNFSLNQINTNVEFGGQKNIVSFNNFKNAAFSATSEDCFFYHNTFKDSGVFTVTGKNNIICKNILDHYGSGLVIIGPDNKAMLNNITYCRIGIAPSPDSTIYANYIAHNEWAINSRNAIINPAGYLNFLTHNNFVDNHYYGVQNLLMPNNTMDYFDNGVVGNYWDIYIGSDSNNDGIGDTPFYLDSNHVDRYPLIEPFNMSTVEEVFPDWLIIPTINVLSPESITYSNANISVDFVLNKQVSWVGYSLDGIENKTITGNLTLTDLPFGTHNITVYANDTYGNQGASQTINFTIKEPFPTLLLAAVSILTGLIVLTSLYILRRHRKNR